MQQHVEKNKENNNEQAHFCKNELKILLLNYELVHAEVNFPLPIRQWKIQKEAKV